MNEQYSQTVEVSVPKGAKAKQWVGIGCILAALGFVMLSVFHSLLWLIAVALFAVAAVINIHFYNDTAREYSYDVSAQRIVIVKKDVVNRQRRLIAIPFENITSFGVMQSMLDEDDIMAANAAYDDGVYELIFRDNDKLKRLLFAPDSYMIEIIKERVDV